MKSWFLIPLAALVGVVAGSWGPREDLKTVREQVRNEVASERKGGATTGFDAFAKLANIPDVARHGSRASGTNAVPRAASAVADGAEREDAAGETHRDTEASDATDPEPSRDVTQEDLSVRLEQAAELWNTRVALARTQWKGRLAIRDEATSAAFDVALDEMNGRLRDSMAALAEEIAAAGKMNAELGLRLMGDLSRTMAETYDTIGAALPEDRRAEVAEMPVYEFIDPMVAEPLIGVQDLLKEDPRWSPRR